jgi:hypothetical protein
MEEAFANNETEAGKPEIAWWLIIWEIILFIPLWFLRTALIVQLAKGRVSA